MSTQELGKIINLNYTFICLFPTWSDIVKNNEYNTTIASKMRICATPLKGEGKREKNY